MKTVYVERKSTWIVVLVEEDGTPTSRDLWEHDNEADALEQADRIVSYHLPAVRGKDKL